VNTLALALGVALAAAAVVLVALPFLREPVPEDDRLDAPTAGESHLLGLGEERDRALAALKELEFDHRTGKVGDEDYRVLLGPLRREAATALRAIDLAPEPPPPPAEGSPPSRPQNPEPGPQE
jgi:hypothetical protein